MRVVGNACRHCSCGLVATPFYEVLKGVVGVEIGIDGSHFGGFRLADGMRALFYGFGTRTVPGGHTDLPRMFVRGLFRQTAVKFAFLTENGVDGMVDDASYFFPHHLNEGARGNLYVELAPVVHDVSELWNPCVVDLQRKITMKVLQEVCPYGG